MNKGGKLQTPFYKIGKYYYDDPKRKQNGEFDVVTLDGHGYIFYECKYRNAKITSSIIDEEIHQVKQTGLECYSYGFFAKNGYETDHKNNIIQYQLNDLFDEDILEN